MQILSDANFESEVLACGTPVLVDFTAVWCGPCRQLEPVLARLTAEWAGAVKVGRLDVDQNPGTTVRFGVMSLPTLILFRSGQPVARLNGALPREKILAQLGPHLG